DGALLPFRGGSADMVTLVNVLDQAHGPLTILQAVHRVLTPGGLLALRVPNARFHGTWARLLIGLGPLARSRGWDTYPVVHHFAFTPAGLRQLVERAGFEVLEVSNSTVASREPVARRPATNALPHWGRAAIAAGAAALAELSRDRWLVGPSVELYARNRPPSPCVSCTRSRGSPWAAPRRTRSRRAWRSTPPATSASWPRRSGSRTPPRSPTRAGGDAGSSRFQRSGARSPPSPT